MARCSLLAVVAALFVVNVEANSSKNIPLGLEPRQIFDAEDFIFDLAGSEPEAEGAGTVQPVGVGRLPALVGEGTSMTLFTVDRCAYNLPHTHPRATEILFVIEVEEDDSLEVEFSQENGGITLTNFIGTGDLTFFPQGLTHFQLNNGCTTARYISMLNSEDGGVITIPSQSVSALDIDAIRVMFTIDAEEAQALRDGTPENPARGLSECLLRCNETDSGGGGEEDDDPSDLNSGELATAIVVPIVFIILVGCCAYTYYNTYHGDAAAKPVAGGAVSPAKAPVMAANAPPPPVAKTARIMSLPPGWQAVTAADGSMYFWNKNTGAVSWDKPALTAGGGAGGTVTGPSHPAMV